MYSLANLSGFKDKKLKDMQAKFKRKTGGPNDQAIKMNFKDLSNIKKQI